MISLASTGPRDEDSDLMAPHHNDLSFVWLVPATAVLLPTILLPIAMSSPAGLSSVAYVARSIYEVAFWAAPAIGLAVLVGLLGVRVLRPLALKRILVFRTVLLACAAVAAPVWLLLLHIVLTGFSR